LKTVVFPRARKPDDGYLHVVVVSSEWSSGVPMLTDDRTQ